MRTKKKSLWELMFKYPSLNSRFYITLAVVFVVAGAIYYVIYKNGSSLNTFEEHVAFLNLLVQALILILGIFGAYYALRQLVETRFTGLDQAGMSQMKNKKYTRAYEKWKEAFYIKPEVVVLKNLCEAALLSGDMITFDHFINLSHDKALTSRKMIIERDDEITFLFLLAIRHLLVKNQGEAEKHIAKLLELLDGKETIKLDWDFSDLQSSTLFLDLIGECKKIAENLIAILKNELSEEQREYFIQGDYAIEESVEEENNNQTQDHPISH